MYHFGMLVDAFPMSEVVTGHRYVCISFHVLECTHVWKWKRCHKKKQV